MRRRLEIVERFKSLDQDELRRWTAVGILVFILVIEMVLFVIYMRDYRKTLFDVRIYGGKIKSEARVIEEFSLLKKKLELYTNRIKTFSSEALVFADVQKRIAEISKSCNVDVRRTYIVKTKGIKDNLFATDISLSFSGSPASVFKFLSELENLTQTLGYIVEKVNARVSVFRGEKDGKKFTMRGHMVLKVVWRKGDER